MRIASLFSGIGGFEYGIQGEPVFASEIDENLHDIYEQHHGIRPFGDITKIAAADIPKHDILTAGFPCQSFSIAGKRLGENDPRGRMFWHVLRVLEHHRPPLFLLENVKYLIHVNDGELFSNIIQSLENLGYKVAWKVLSPHLHADLPQRRFRVFIAGSLDKMPDLDIMTRRSPDLREFLDENPTEVRPIPPQQLEAFELWEKTIKENGLLQRRSCLEDYNVDGSHLSKTNNKLQWSGDTYRDFWDSIIMVRQSGIRLTEPHTAQTITAMQVSQTIGWLKRNLGLSEAVKLQGYKREHLSTNTNKAWHALGNAVCVDIVREIMIHNNNFSTTSTIPKS